MLSSAQNDPLHYQNYDIRFMLSSVPIQAVAGSETKAHFGYSLIGGPNVKPVDFASAKSNIHY